MKRSLIALGLLVVCSVVVQAQGPAQGKEPVGSGWWKLSLEKSSYDPGPRPKPPVSQVRHYRVRSDGFWVMSIFGADPQGHPNFSQTVFKLDGQDRQSTLNDETLAEFQTTGKRPVAVASQKAIDPYTVEIINKVDGKVTTTLTRTVSKDGKTFTLTTKGTNPQGQRINNVEIFERIP